MEKYVTGTLVDGVVRLDEQVDIPNNSRVRVTLQTSEFDDDADTIGETDPMKRKAAVERFLMRCKEHPVDGGGSTFSSAKPSLG